MDENTFWAILIGSKWIQSHVTFGLMNFTDVDFG